MPTRFVKSRMYFSKPIEKIMQDVTMVRLIVIFTIIQLVTIQMIVKRDSFVTLELQPAEVGNILHKNCISF